MNKLLQLLTATAEILERINIHIETQGMDMFYTDEINAIIAERKEKAASLSQGEILDRQLEDLNKAIEDFKESLNKSEEGLWTRTTKYFGNLLNFGSK